MTLEMRKFTRFNRLASFVLRKVILCLTVSNEDLLRRDGHLECDEQSPLRPHLRTAAAVSHYLTMLCIPCCTERVY